MSTHGWTDGADALAEDVLRVDVDHRPGCAVLRAEGEVDTLTGALFADRIAETIDGAASGDLDAVVLDLSRIGFFGSPGIAGLVHARRVAREHKLALRLVCHGGAVIMPLTVTGLIDQFDVYPDLAAAVA
ncbi:MAG TPA: STAS domain-containing protein [Pseudonocardiaceae bacterium]